MAQADLIPAHKVGEALAAVQRGQFLLLNDERARSRKLAEDAREDGRRAGLNAGLEAYERGSFPLRRLNANEYRDTGAVLAEVRSLGFAARLSYSDPDGCYTVEALLYRSVVEWGSRRIAKEFSSREEAGAFYSRVLNKFYRIDPFICRVDY